MRCSGLYRESRGGRKSGAWGRFRSGGMHAVSPGLVLARPAPGAQELAGLPVQAPGRSRKAEQVLPMAASKWTTRLAGSCLALALLPFCAMASSDEDWYWEVQRGCQDLRNTELYLARVDRGDFSGKYAEQARGCLPRLREQQAAWSRLESCRSKADVEQFLNDYPNLKGSVYAEKARECLGRWSDVNFRVERMLEVCEIHFEANRLLTGIGGTAVACYEEVLALDSSNRKAIEGLSRVFDKYLRWARSNLGRGKVAKAKGYLEKLETLNPEAPEISELEEALGAFERHLDQGHAALEEGNRVAAQEHADALKELYPNAPQVRELEAAIAQAPPAPTPDPTTEPAPEPTPEPAREVGEEFRDCDDSCPLMVVVPAGSYTMGNGWMPPESPEHIVTIAKPFAVGVYEVTFEEWDACHAARGCSHHPEDERWGRGSRPVINVSLEDARQYVRWLSAQTGETYRLPSEAEWEYVARAGSTRAYTWGSSFYVAGSKKANCSDCGGREAGRKTMPVGSFDKNRFGLHDVHGNVWERLEDCRHTTYDGAPGDGRVWGGGHCALRSMRGGSWKDKAFDIRTSHRGWGGSNRRTNNAGFRVVRELAP